MEKGVFKHFTKFTECTRVSFSIKMHVSTRNFIKKQVLTHVFSSEFCKIFKNTLFTEHLRATASVEVHQTCKFFRINYRVVFRIFPSISDQFFCKNSQWLKAINPLRPGTTPSCNGLTICTKKAP